MAKRKLDNLGYARGESGFANDPERIKRLKIHSPLTGPRMEEAMPLRRPR
jgi:hypothetical protein